MAKTRGQLEPEKRGVMRLCAFLRSNVYGLNESAS